MGNFLDTAIGFFAPEWGARRLAAREVMASFNGAVPTRQDTTWQLDTGNPALSNGDLANGALAALRSRSRQLCQNNAIASGIIDRVVTNVIGANGFGLHANSDNTDWNKRVEELFFNWQDTADITGNSWLEYLRLGATHWQRDGDFGTILRQDGRLQPIVPELIETPYGKLSDTSFIDGVQVDPTGRPLQYWITGYDGYTRKSASHNIAAQDFLFIARKKSFGQQRGQPCFANSLRIFDQIDQLQHAVLQATKIQAYIALAITKQNVAQVIKGIPREKNSQGKPDTEKKRQQKIEPGSTIYLNPGEDIKAITPTQPGSSFPENFILNIRTLGLESGLPLELTLLDFSKTNYSSARAALLQAYATFRTMQNLFISSILSRIYRWRVSKWIKEGKLPQNDQAFYHRWIATPFPYLDPVKEIQATQMGIDCGLQTLTAALLAQGQDWNDWLAVRTREVAEMKAAGIPLYHSSALQEQGSKAPNQNIEGDSEQIGEGE